MNRLKAAALIAAFAFLVVSVSLPRGVRVPVSATGGAVSKSELSQVVQVDAGDAAELPMAGSGSPVELSVLSVTSDSGLYHSADRMVLTAVVGCSADAEGVTVRATGVSGKMDLEQTVNMTEGNNTVTFDYQLPRCNVCGGIRPGTYPCQVEAAYGDSSSSGSVEVQIE